MEIIEWLGVITGITAVFLLYKNHILTWPIGFINIGAFMWMFWQQKLYGDFLVQIIFLTTGVLGWINWGKNLIKIPSSLNLSQNFMALIFTLMSIPMVSFYFKNYTNCSYPLAEASILCLSITGQFLTALRKLENWVYWLLADLLMIIVYTKKELYPTAIYAGVIFIIGIFGLLHWKKIIKHSM